MENEIVQSTAKNKRSFVMCLILVFLIIFAVIFFLLLKTSEEENLAAANLPVFLASNKTNGFVPGELLVKFRSSVSDLEANDFISKRGLKVKNEIKPIKVKIISVPEEAEERLASALSNNPIIEFAEVNSQRVPSLTPNDPWYPNEWHLGKIGAPSAWDINTGNSSIIIAILDTGVDSTHPDLSSKIVPGWNVYDGNSNTNDVGSHGTMVAGAAAATGNNNIGVASPAWGSKIMPIRISNPSGTATFSSMASGLIWASDHGARVANISYEASESSSVASAAQYFQGKGGVVTVAAGNGSTFVAAANNPYVLTVGAVNADDVIYPWSNTGNITDLVAPGGAIFTTYPGGTYTTAAGTSLASPLVAGVAALVLSVNPNLTGAEAYDIVRLSIDDLGTSGWDTTYGNGRLNAYKAVTNAGGQLPPTDTTPPTTSITSPITGSTLSGLVTVSVIATDNVAVSKVELLKDSSLYSSDINSPYTFAWDTTKESNGSHTLRSVAYDNSGNISTSSIITITISNLPDSQLPIITSLLPADGSTIKPKGNLIISAKASDNVAVAEINVIYDGQLQNICYNSTSCSATISSKKITAGTHTVSARAYDTAQNTVIKTNTITK